VIKASERMARLIDDLLNYSRVGRRAIQSSPISLKQIFDEISVNLAGRLEQSGGTLIITGDLPVVKGDLTLLRQIFTNLLDNAITYHRADIPPHLEVVCEQKNGYVTVNIKDNGIGIPPQYHEKIFQVFQRLHTEDEYPGTGIGLAIVKKSVEMLNGQIGLESIVGQGSTFWVRVPR
jgi:signal transduction histidine kinase